MKKLKLTIALLLALAMLFSFGCSIGGTPKEFKGNYKTASAEEIEEFSATVSEPTNNQVAWDNGIEMLLEVKANNKMSGGSGGKMDISAKINSALNEYDEVIMSGKVSSKMNGSGLNSNEGFDFFYEDNYMYMKNSNGTKIKEYTPADEVMDELDFDEYVTNINLSDAVRYIEELSHNGPYGEINIKNKEYGMEKSKDGTKISLKLEINYDANIEGISMANNQTVEYYFSYDADNVLVGVYTYTFAKTSGSYAGESFTQNTEMTFYYIPSTEKVKLPNDLDTYREYD